MSRIPDLIHPRCPGCNERMRPLYYTPLESPAKKRAPGLWYCPKCKEIHSDKNI